MRDGSRRPRVGTVAFAGSVVVASLVVAVPAAADDDCAPWCAGVGDPGGDGNGDGDGQGPTPVGQPSGHAWYDFGLDRDDADELCWYPEFLGYRPAAPPVADTWAYVDERITEWTSDDIGPTRCPGTEDAFDPGELARSFWLSADPDPSAPRIDPQEAITGLRTYLVLEGPTTIELADDTPLGRLTISGRVSYEIDWGDGHVTTTDHQGLPYPGGATEITHVYTDVGTYTVTVTSVWSGSWTAGGLSGELSVLRRDASTTLPVTERQAVRVD
ncbi:MAG: PKD domain-containing protein [Nitriliruptor sp.]|uniref:PKD domain-containing protein n=1 Tax=Nitriliruptor sp. TaxID=2448056 RepID=UPI0034A0A4BA